MPAKLFLPFVAVLPLMFVLGTLHANEARNPVPNPGFEVDENHDGMPDGWTFTWKYTHSGDRGLGDIKREPRWRWDDKVVHSGKRSVHIANDRKQDDGVWTAARFPVVKGTKIYSVSCWIKTKNMNQTDAKVCAVYHDEKGKWLGANYNAIVVKESADWKEYSGLIEVPAKAATIMIRLWLNMGYSGTGEVWYDDVELAATELQDMPPIEYVDGSPMPRLSPADSERGYVLFERNYLEMVFPASIPRKEELDPRLDMFATAGEYEPAAFCIRAMKPLEDVRLSATPLRRADGEEIGADHVRVRPVECLMRRGQARWGEFADGEMLVPAYIADSDTTTVGKDETRQIWVTVKVPESAPPGKYTGEIIVRPANAAEARVPVELEVLPFRLVEPEDVYFGMYARMWDDEEEVMRRFKDMREHGMTTVGACGPLGAEIEMEGGKVKVTFDGASNLETAMKAYMAAGFPRPFVWLMSSDVMRWCRKQGELESDEFARCYRQVVEAILAEGRKRGWPEIIWQPLDEPFEHTQRLAATKRCLQILKTIPGLRTEEDGPNGNPSTLEELYDLCDILVYHDGPVLQRGTYDARAWAQFLERLKKDGKEVWFYNIDLTGYHPEVMRFGYGFGLKAARATGMIEWSYMTAVRPEKPEVVYERSRAYTFRYPKTAAHPGGPSIGWEATREGVDDYKYIATLERLIAKCRKTGGKAAVPASEAERFLEKHLAGVDFNGCTGRACQGDWTGKKGWLKGGGKFVSGSYKMAIGWRFADYDRTRREIADWIIKLMES